MPLIDPLLDSDRKGLIDGVRLVRDCEFFYNILATKPREAD